MNVLLAGGTGFIGKALTRFLIKEGHDVVILTRNEELDNKTSEQLKYLHWNGKDKGPWTDAVEDAQVVINLAGESIVDKRWSEKRKKDLIQSRAQSTRALVTAIHAAAEKPSIFVSASAVGYYGDVLEGDVLEGHPGGDSFPARVCEVWEQEARAAQAATVPVAILRIGVVLDKSGGALKRMLLPFQLGLGGPLGSGNQWFPWIHLDDMVGAINHIISPPRREGLFNITAPEPLRMKDFAVALGKALNRPAKLPVPEFALKLLLGERSEILLTGQKAIPGKLLETGYRFNYPNIDAALEACLKDE